MFLFWGQELYSILFDMSIFLFRGCASFTHFSPFMFNGMALYVYISTVSSCYLFILHGLVWFIAKPVSLFSVEFCMHHCFAVLCLRGQLWKSLSGMSFLFCTHASSQSDQAQSAPEQLKAIYCGLVFYSHLNLWLSLHWICVCIP